MSDRGPEPGLARPPQPPTRPPSGPHGDARGGHGDAAPATDIDTPSPRSPPRQWDTLDRIAFVVATFFGSGLSPVAPGTAGTLATIPLYLLLALTASTSVYIGATVGLLVLGVWAATRTSHRVGLKDPGIVVIDETVGLLVTMTLVTPSAASVLLGFLVFRALDVLKPFGIRKLEQLPGGYGIMMDDFAAGVVGNVVVRLLLDLRPQQSLGL